MCALALSSPFATKSAIPANSELISTNIMTSKEMALHQGDSAVELLIK